MNNLGNQYKVAIERLSGDTPLFPLRCKKCNSVLVRDNFKDVDITFLIRYSCQFCQKTKLIKEDNQLNFIDFEKN